MTDRYASDYYDFLQTIRDREDELAQTSKRHKKLIDKRLRDVTQLLNACVTAMEGGVSKQEMAALWKDYVKIDPSLKPIARFLFGNSK